MSWLSNRMLAGRLRTGPTALLPARPDPKALLAIAQLADPEARVDGEDIVAGGVRIHPAVELTGEMLTKLGVEDEERLWACRVAADGPLPVDFFDKTLAEGIAYRLGGWSLCRGEPTDPAEDEHRGPLVYLPSPPTEEEAVTLLRELLKPVESLDEERWPEGELLDGIVRVAPDAYAGAEIVVVIEEGRRIPPAARIRWPYLTEIFVASPGLADGDDVPTGDEALLARGRVALALADKFQGIATDRGDFQIAQPEDLLPARFA